MSEFDVVVIFIFGILLGFYVGTKYAYNKIANLLENELDNIEKEESEASNKKIINIYIEVKDGMIFAYNADTNDFLANAETGNALVEKLKIRFPNKMYMATQEDMEKILGKD